MFVVGFAPKLDLCWEFLRVYISEEFCKSVEFVLTFMPVAL